MTSVLFYFDEDFLADSITRGLRRAGWSVITATDERTEGWTDEAQISHARVLRRAIVTSNTSDFTRLHRKIVTRGEHHHGIVIVTQGDFGIGETIRRLSRLAASLSAEEMVDRLEYLSDWGDR